MKFELVEDWKAILKKAWVVKFNIAAALLGALEVAVALVKPASIPNGIFAAIAVFVSLAANGARIMAQVELRTTATVKEET